MPYTYYQIVLTFVVSARLTLTLAAEPPAPVRLPGDVPPVIGCWFWRDNEFAPGGYRPFLDMVADMPPTTFSPLPCAPRPKK